MDAKVAEETPVSRAAVTDLADDCEPQSSASTISDGGVLIDDHQHPELDRRIVRKIDLRLCTIAGILCALESVPFFFLYRSPIFVF